MNTVERSSERTRQLPVSDHPVMVDDWAESLVDLECAQAISDRIGVMNGGTLVQLAPPPEVYAHPVDSFVSTFLGTSNRVPVKLTDDGVVTVLGREITGVDPVVRFVHVRPEHIRLLRNGLSDNGVPARVRSVSFLGPLTRASCSVGDTDILLDLSSSAADGLAVDDRVRVVLDGPVTLAAR